jgi:hypothetical protein
MGLNTVHLGAGAVGPVGADTHWKSIRRAPMWQPVESIWSEHGSRFSLSAGDGC